MVIPWRTITGAEPGAVKAASPVLNGEDEETGRKALRLVLTQLPRIIEAILLLKYTVNARILLVSPPTLHTKSSHAGAEARYATCLWPPGKFLRRGGGSYH